MRVCKRVWWSCLWSPWWLVIFFFLWRHLFGRGYCKLESSVLGSSVDHCKASSVDSGNPSRRWRRGVERWLEPRNKYLCLRLSFALALHFAFKFLLHYIAFNSCLWSCFFLSAITSSLWYLWYIVFISLFIHHTLPWSIISHTIRLHCAPLTHSRGIGRKEFRTSRGIRLLVLFWEIVASFILVFFLKDC